MSFLDTLKLELKTWRLAQRVIAVLHTTDPVDGSIVPVPTGGLGGGGTITVTPRVPVATFTGDTMNVTAERGLNVPANATHALVTVEVGAARMGYGSATTAVSFGVGGGVEVEYAQLAALRIAPDGGMATVRAEYWQEA